MLVARFPSPFLRPNILSAAIAQSVERILGKDEVASSNLASSSKKRTNAIRCWFFFMR